MPELTDLKSLRIAYILNSADEYAPSEFADLFSCIEDYSRSVAESEGLAFLQWLGLSSRERIQAIREIRTLGRSVRTPAEVEAIQRGSWKVTVVLSAALLARFLWGFVRPVLDEAWQGSRAHEATTGFLRERLFGGARKTLEEKAVKSPRYGNLEVIDVVEGDQLKGVDADLIVRLRRTEIIEAQLPNEESLRRFLEELQRWGRR